MPQPSTPPVSATPLAEVVPFVRNAPPVQPAPVPHARPLQFEYADDLNPHFCPSQPEFSHAANGFMSALPVLEPYFITTLREALPRIEDPDLQTQVQLFVTQEGRHAQQHRALNQALTRHYPELPAMVQAIKARLDRSKTEQTLAYRLAYTAGYETITYHLVAFMMEQRNVWLSDADPSVFALLCWHGAEEVEHKSVAFDVFQAVSGSYRLRLLGLLDALISTVKDLRRIMQYMLTVDGLWSQPECRKRTRRVRLSFLRDFAPRLRVYLRPGYHPGQYADPKALQWWLERYAAGDDMRRLTPQAIDAALAPDDS